MEYKDFLELAQKSIQERILIGKGSFDTYHKMVESFKSEHSDIIKRYGLIETELFVMFMMLSKNNDEIQQQFFSSEKATLFTKECARQYDSFLNKAPVSSGLMHYRLERYSSVDDFEKLWKFGKNFECHHYLTASTSIKIFEKLGDGVKLYISRPLIDKESKARDVFKIFNANEENQVNYKRNTRFQIDSVNKNNKTVYITEL